MVRQFAINTRRRYLCDPTIIRSVNENPNQCISWVEPTRSSKYRHETHACQHSILVIASVVDVKISEKMSSIILCDSIGEKIIALLPSFKIDGDLASLLSSFQSETVMVLSFSNPLIFVETFPLHSEDSCKMFLLCSEENVQLIDIHPRVMTTFRENSTAIREASVCRKSFLEMTIFLEQYMKLSSNNNSLLQGVPSTNLHSEYFQKNHQRFVPHPPYHVREVLMYDIYPRQRTPLSCIVGVVRSISFIPSTSSSSCSPDQSSHKKLRMEYVEKFLVELEDVNSCDLIKVYLPVTSATRSLCTSGMIIFIFHPFLKCSKNYKSIYLECKLDEFSIGRVCTTLPLSSSSALLSRFSFCSSGKEI